MEALLGASAPSCGGPRAAAAAGWWQRWWHPRGGLRWGWAGPLAWPGLRSVLCCAVLCWGDCSAGGAGAGAGGLVSPVLGLLAGLLHAVLGLLHGLACRGRRRGKGGSGREGRMIGQRCGRGAAAERQAAWSAQAPPHPGPANCARWRRQKRLQVAEAGPTNSAQVPSALKPSNLGPPPTRPPTRLPTHLRGAASRRPCPGPSQSWWGPEWPSGPAPGRPRSSAGSGEGQGGPMCTKGAMSGQ